MLDEKFASWEEYQSTLDFFNENIQPKEFNPYHQNNEIVKAELDFEQMCVGMQEAHIHTLDLSVFQFYACILHFDKKSNKYGNQQK